MVCWEIDKDPGSSPRSRGCAWMGWLLLLERLSCRICYQASHSVLVKYPNTGHGELRERGREGAREMARDVERDCKMGACSVCDV